MEPAARHYNSGPGVPRVDGCVPTTPLSQRPVSLPLQTTRYSCTATHPLPLRAVSLDADVQSVHTLALPPPPALLYRRTRRLQFRPTPHMPGPTLASIGVDRQDTPSNFRSINSILAAKTPRDLARPLLPTPDTASTSFTASRSNHELSMTDHSSPQSVVVMDGSAEQKHLQAETMTLNDNRGPPAPPGWAFVPGHVAMPSKAKEHKQSKFVEHLDMSASVADFGSYDMHVDPSGYEGDDEKAL